MFVVNSQLFIVTRVCREEGDVNTKMTRRGEKVERDKGNAGGCKKNGGKWKIV